MQYDYKVVEDPILTNIAAEYKNDDLIADQLFPELSVAFQSGKYEIHPPYYAEEDQDDVRAPGAEANEITGYEYEYDNYYCAEKALQSGIPDERRQNNTSKRLKVDADAINLVTSRILMGREAAMIKMATDENKYLASLHKTLVGNAQWSHADSDPEVDARNARMAIHKESGLSPDTVVVGYAVYEYLRAHPKLRGLISNNKDRFVSDELIKQALGVDNLIVSKAKVGKGRGFATQTSYMWDDSVLFCTLKRTDGMPGFGREFVWGKPFVDRWREEHRVRDVVRYRRRYDLKAIGIVPTGSDAGKIMSAYLLKDVLA